MKYPRILIVAPSSYPLYGAEANVNAKIIKILSDAGCQIDLVSRGLKSDKCYPPSFDELFFKNVNSITTIPVNTKKDIKTIIRHIRTYITSGYIYKGCDWAVEAIAVCESLLKINKYDYVYTYDYPSEIAGLYLAKKYNLKWVATWNDPYVWDRYPAPYGGGIHSGIGKMREKLIGDIGKYTYRNLFPSKRLMDYMLSYMTNMNPDSCLISPHILLNELEHNNTPQKGGCLKIIHAGALGKERDPKTLVEGLSLFLKKRPDASLMLTLMGTFERMANEYFNNLVSQYDVKSHIECIPPIPYLESLKAVRKYDLCLIVEAPCEVGIFLPSKVSDYMQNNKPIFAISPKVGVLHDMFIKNEINYFADNTSPEEIAAIFEQFYSDHLDGRLGANSGTHDQYRNQVVLDIHKKFIFNS